MVELETLYTHWRKGAADEMNAGITSNNIAYVTSDPLYAIVRFFHSGQIAPVGVGRGGAPPRGMTLVHTSRWPQVGHRSGWASPRWAHTVCQSNPPGTTTGGCPSAARHSASAAVCVAWYSP